MFFIAAAGNNGRDNDTFPFYPASIDLPHVIAVAATDRNDNRASFSNFGKTSVDLAAPGVSIMSTKKGNVYQLLSGTSMACPHVAGAVALMLAYVDVLGLNVTPVQIRNHLLATVDVIPSMVGKVVSNGRLNVNDTLGPALAAPPGFSIGQEKLIHLPQIAGFKIQDSCGFGGII
jgi:subtilisin family serine protease